MIENNQEDINLEFHGPYSMRKGSNYLFSSKLKNEEGVYLWTLKDETSGKNYINYIGETQKFAKRHREHIIQITGLNYQINDPEKVKKGDPGLLWNGLWRDRTNQGVGNMLDNYERLSSKVVEYVSLISIYFAPIKLDRYTRRHVEGSIGWNLRNNHPEATVFYPKDNHVGANAKGIGCKLIINLPDKIEGVDTEIII